MQRPPPPHHQPPRGLVVVGEEEGRGGELAAWTCLPSPLLSSPLSLSLSPVPSLRSCLFGWAGRSQAEASPPAGEEEVLARQA